MIKLNKQQKEAAQFLQGTCAVIAVPGSGKTLTMTHRIANLVKNHDIPPESILGLTFTRNAAQAMKDKLKPLLQELSDRVLLATIHSFCHGLLRAEGRSFGVLYGTEQIKLIRQIMKHHKIKNLPAGMVLQEINLAKNNLVLSTEFKDLYHGDKTMEKIADVYEGYEQEKKKRLLMDFNDLLLETHNILKDRDDVREKYQETYPHILVDEFQDTNPAQMQILKLLAGTINGNGNKASFWICGDDWQSIYGFTGATVGNILNFSKSFPEAKQFILDINYRSTPQILNFCQSLIDHNEQKIEKLLKTDNKPGEAVVILTGATEDDEALQIILEIKDLKDRHGYSFKDIALLYRNNSQSRVIEEAFSQYEIPYHIENGLNFYQRHEVRILLDYLRLIADPLSDEGDEALRNIINIPNRYIGRKFLNELEDFAINNELHLYEALKRLQIDVPYVRKNVKLFISFIDDLVKQATQAAPSEMIYLLREVLEYDSYITEEDVPSPDDSKISNINQLQLAANRYKDIRALLSYTESFRDELSNNKEGVSLMTIHKAKGLEFPAVFVIGMVEGVLPNKQGDLDEERRIAFVGISRAMKLLYLTYPHTYMGRNIKRSSFLDEMMTDRNKGSATSEYNNL